MATVIAIDQGTTATKVLTLEEGGELRLVGERRHRQIFPSPGWVEHDAGELEGAVREALASGVGAAAGPPAGFALDNQGETVVAWDAQDGRALWNAIVWQDTRTNPEVQRLKDDGAEALTLSRAGLPLDPYFSASKLRWLLDHAPRARAALRAGRLRLATSDSFLIERLTGSYVTDVTTASRTSLMNLRTCQWDAHLCELFGVPLEALPEIRPSTGDFGVARVDGRAIGLRAALVDQQASLFGHGCTRPGEVKITFGTGAFALAHAGCEPPVPETTAARGMLATLAWQICGEPPSYALDGGVYHAGAAVEWLRRLGLFSELAELADYPGPTAAEQGLIFVPALSGLGSPHWDRSAAGLWIGMRPETTREDLCRAVLEGVALRGAELVEGFAELLGATDRIPADGGLTRSAYFCRMLAAASGRTVVLPAIAEMTGYGAARLGLLGAGIAGSLTALPARPPARASFEPHGTLAEARERFAAAVQRARGWWQS